MFRGVKVLNWNQMKELPSNSLMNSNAINIGELTKVYRGGVRALDRVSIEVKQGEIFGLLGPNGAGKTTLVKILLGALSATSGDGELYGRNIGSAASRERIGFLPENHRFPSYLTGKQLLAVYGGMAGLAGGTISGRSDELLRLVRMEQWQKTKIRKYSKGMMQRIGLAQALLNDPDLIFLDEPTDGVDPVGRHEIRQIVLDLKGRGKTIFLNSHLLAEVESVCDRVAVLDKGRLLKSGPARNLIEALPTFRIETSGITEEQQAKIKEAFSHGLYDKNIIRISFHKESDVNALIDFLRGMKIEILAVIPDKKSLEENFIQLIRGAQENQGGTA